MGAAITATWVLIGGLALAFEVYTIERPAKRDTLSEHVWAIRAKLWGRIVLYAAWGWLTWHFIVDEFYAPGRKTAADDWVVVISCAVVGGAVGLVKARKARSRA